MVEYFKKQELIDAKKQKTKTILIYLIVVMLYFAYAVPMLLWYLSLPYKDPQIVTVKLLQFAGGALIILFSALYLGIAYRRIRDFYKVCLHLDTGLRETSVGAFLEYDASSQQKDGVDCKALIFVEWDKYKKDFFERKVLVFYEKEFPVFEPNQNVKYVTQGNVLVSYEILE